MPVSTFAKPVRALGGGVTYKDVVSVENLLEAWGEFVKGKRKRRDVQEFGRSLMDNLFDLHEHLQVMTYKHDPYEMFVITDPKTRRIHKASVADRVVHRAVYRKLYPLFDLTFISDSFSSRVHKGTHKALDRFRVMAWKASHNHHRTVWVLQCDIRKFFASIDQEILMKVLTNRLEDEQLLWLIHAIVTSFSTQPGKGLPLGNLTSQIFSNIYLNELDQFVKYVLKVKFYIRYADDFVLLSHNRRYLEQMQSILNGFLARELKIQIHPNKNKIKSLASGVDFLGWVHFPHHRTLRSTTRRRMVKSLADNPCEETITSYKGLLGHGDAYGLSREIDDMLDG